MQYLYLATRPRTSRVHLPNAELPDSKTGSMILKQYEVSEVQFL